MSAANATVLIAELEGAVKGGSAERRVQMLRQVTDLFLSDADRMNESQIAVFDDVLVRLIERMEVRTLAQLSSTLSDCNTAPRDVVRQLAYHGEASIAVPILAKSSRISDTDLIEIAKTRGQQHLLAISSRASLNEPLTDVLLERGNSSVSHALANNAGARFSAAGYSALVQTAEKDESLAEKLGIRLDLSANLLRELLSKATAAVRARLLKAAPPDMRDKIQNAIQTINDQIGFEVPKPVDYTASETAVIALNRAGKLGDQTINRFAVQQEYTNIIAALSLLSSVKIDAIEPLIGNPRPDGLIVACKAARLNWSTTAMVVRNRPGCSPLSKPEFEQGKEMFEALSLSAAQRTIRFWSVRSAARKSDAPETSVAVSDI